MAVLCSAAQEVAEALGLSVWRPTLSSGVDGRRGAFRGMTRWGDPRGVGELAGTATGIAFVVHGFARV